MEVSNFVSLAVGNIKSKTIFAIYSLNESVYNGLCEYCFFHNNLHCFYGLAVGKAAIKLATYNAFFSHFECALSHLPLRYPTSWN